MKITQLGALAFALALNPSICFAAEGREYPPPLKEHDPLRLIKFYLTAEVDTVAELNERTASPDTASTAIVCPLLVCPLNVAAVRDPSTGFCGCPCPGPIRICPNRAPSYYNHVTRLCQCRCLGIVCPLDSGPALIDAKTGICKCSPLPTPTAA